MINVLIDKLNEDKESYNLILTNYTCLIETNDYDYHFLKHLQRSEVFGVANELKKYVSTCLEHIPYIDRDTMKYYSAKVMTKPMYRKKAYNIDINAAYPTCLFLSGLIDQKLYFKLMALDKQERLAAIGMLASRKRRFRIEKGEVVDYKDDESEYSRYFFHCVQTIANIIWQCEIVAGTSFIYSWVDGLYVLNKEYAYRCKDLIVAAGYKATVAEIQDFQYTPLENRVVIEFLKDGENKLFNIPIENNRLAQILKFLHR